MCMGKTVTGWGLKGPSFVERKEFVIKDLTLVMFGKTYPCELFRVPDRLDCNNDLVPLFNDKESVSLEIYLGSGEAKYIYMLIRPKEEQIEVEDFTGTCKALLDR